MNFQRKKAAVKKAAALLEKGMSKEDVLDMLKTDSLNLTESEFSEISDVVNSEAFTSAWTDDQPFPDTFHEPEQKEPENKPEPLEEKKETEMKNEPEILPGASENRGSIGTANVVDVSMFDYKNLTGKSFKEYVSLAGDPSYSEFDAETGETKTIVPRLKANEMYDFGVYKVDVVMKDRFPGIKDTPRDFIGVKVKTDTPEMVTRIRLSQAHELNSQIMNAHGRAGFGKYYLLRK